MSESPTPRADVASLIASNDWARTSLGPRDAWPASLRTVLQLMLSSRYAMWMGWGPDLAFFYNDAYAEQTLGIKHPWALGRPAREVWPEIWDDIAPRVERVVGRGESTWDEGLFLMLGRNGYPEETYHTFSYSPAPGEVAGEIGGLFCVVIEETERVVGARRIALLAELASALARTASVEQVMHAAADCLLAASKDIPFAVTYLRNELSGALELAGSTGLPSAHPAFPQSIASDQATPWSLPDDATEPVRVALSADVVWPTGAWERSPAHALVLPIPAAGQGRPAGVFVAAVNPHRPFEDTLTSFVQLVVSTIAAARASALAHEAERKRADALAEIDRAKTVFFSNVSHELRTPLTLMLGPTEDALASPARALSGDDLGVVHRNARRLLKLVNALLDFARIEAGRANASFAREDLAALTTDLASAFRSAVERGGLVFDVRCPPLRGAYFVDRALWEKVVFNLLSNALKFTLEGRIEVSLHEHEDSVQLVVADTGAGIAADELPRLFERFHRIPGVRARTQEGTGIGLALVHDLVHLHGGTIAAESTLGRGTRFTVTVPAGSAHLPADQVVATAPATDGSASLVLDDALAWLGPEPSSSAGLGPLAEPPPRDPRRERIVVVDDNADMRGYLSRLLRDRWDVETYADGEDALAAIRRDPPALVLSDVMMPRLDGFGLLKALRADPQLQRTPFVLLSARAGEEASAEGLGAGADDYVVKPFAARDLLVRITSRLAITAAAREANLIRENLYRHFMQAPFPVAVFRGPTHIVELANQATLRAWHRTEHEALGKPLAAVMPELVAQPFLGYLDGVFATGEVYEGRAERAVLATDRPGEQAEAWFTFVYAPLFGTDGRIEGVLMSAFDVSAQVHGRQEVEAARDRAEALAGELESIGVLRARALEDAERTSRAKDEFLATMSHELRTPLNAILGWAKLLRATPGQPPPDEKQLAHGLAVIERNAQAQARIVGDLLDVSRVINGKLLLSVQRVDLGAVVLAAVEVVKQAADARAVRLEVDLAPDLGTMQGDPDRLQQVVWNLLSNAVKFTPSQGVVTVRAVREPSTIKLTVTDTGVGIAPADLPLVFERFKQVDSSTTRAHGGLGLGLSIVKHLVEAHGGSVEARSRGRGHGAELSVTLPIRQRFVDADGRRLVTPPGEHSPVPPRSPTKPLRGVQAIIVDDEEDSRDLLALVLEHEGATVTSKSSADEVLAALSTARFDVLVSDIGMPDKDGYTLVREIRARGLHLPAVALTAYVRSEDAAKAVAAGYQQHLPKPVDAVELVKVLTRLLGR